MTTSDFIKNIQSGKAQVLTAQAAAALKGRRIAWMYFGYSSNINEVKEMTVGETFSEWDFYKFQPMEGYANRTAEWATWMTPAQQAEKQRRILLLDEDLNNYGIVCDPENPEFEKATFCCSDMDREVYYMVLDEEEPNEIVIAQIISYRGSDVRTTQRSREYTSARWLRRKLREMAYPYSAIWDGAEWNCDDRHCTLALVGAKGDRFEHFMGE